jgi:hypothetical protein
MQDLSDLLDALVLELHDLGVRGEEASDVMSAP